MARSKQNLDLIGLRKILASLPKDAFVVGFYINFLFSSQNEWMNALAEALRARGIVTVGLLSSRSVQTSNMAPSDLDATDFVAVIPANAVRLLNRINVFVISDVDRTIRFPPTSKVLGCIHGYAIASAEAPLLAEMDRLGFLDGLMVPARLTPEIRHALKKAWTGFVSPHRTQRSDRPFQLISVGYPRHASMLQALNQADVPRDAIVYAPYTMDCPSSARPCDRLDGQGAAIINFLLQKFPEYSIIFRPAPGDRKRPIVQYIGARFHNEPRFILDRHDDQIFAFSRGAALITDLSSISRSFAYLTLRPAIYFQPWQKWEHPMERWDGGFVASTYDALCDVLTLALGHAQDEAQTLRQNRDRLVMPIEGALDAIAEWIKDFYNERPRADWVTIDRSAEALESEKELVQKLATFTLSLPLAAAAVAYFRNPESPLLVAYTLHVAREQTPRELPHMDVLGMAGRLLGVHINSATYEETPPEYIQKLYAMAEDAYRQQGDSDGVTLVTELLRDFNAAISKK